LDRNDGDKWAILEVSASVIKANSQQCITEWSWTGNEQQATRVDRILLLTFSYWC